MKIGLVWVILAGLFLAVLSTPLQAQVTTRELQKPGGKLLPGLDVLEISSFQSGKQRYLSPFNNFSGDLDGAIGPIFNATTCTSCHVFLGRDFDLAPPLTQRSLRARNNRTEKCPSPWHSASPLPRFKRSTHHHDRL